MTSFSDGEAGIEMPGLNKKEKKFLKTYASTSNFKQACKAANVKERQGYNIKKALIEKGYIHPRGEVVLLQKSLPIKEIAETRWGPKTEPKWWDSPNIDHDGTWSPIKPSDEPPMGFSRCHLSNSMLGVPVVSEGEMCDLRDSRGFVFGFWVRSDNVETKAYSQYPLEIVFGNSRLKGYYRVGKLGSKTLRFNLEDIYLDPMYYPDPQSIISLFEKRLAKVCSSLEKHGWVFGDAFEFNGGIHFAFPDHIWADYLDRTVKLDDGQVICDHSHGKIEIELENGVTKEGFDAAGILAHAPAHLTALNRRTSELTMEIVDLRAQNEIKDQELLALATRVHNLQSIVEDIYNTQRISTQWSAETLDTMKNLQQTVDLLVQDSKNKLLTKPDEKKGYQ